MLWCDGAHPFHRCGVGLNDTTTAGLSALFQTITPPPRQTIDS